MEIFKETELCLGLPGGGGGGGKETVETPAKATGKRGFSETLAVDLNLNHPMDDSKELVAVDLMMTMMKKENNNNNNNPLKSPLPLSSMSKEKNLFPPSTSNADKDPSKPPAKAQVVGWPPVRSYRKNIMSQKSSSDQADDQSKTGDAKKQGNANAATAAFVKVCMDGAPYLRKVDLKTYQSYQQLSDALGKMFSSFTMGNYGAQGMIDFMNENKLMDLLNTSEYVPTYEDKDGDWMLVGDVPWEMFVASCKRLRIMKGSEAIGLAPKAMEKCKSRT